MDQSILQHPHSRFIASTNYTQHYTSSYENEIVSKKTEFDYFFKRYKGIKEDEKAFTELCDLMQKYKNKSKSKPKSKSKGKEEFELQLQINKFADINKNRGIMTEEYDFLKNTLDSVQIHTKSTNDYIKKTSGSIGKQKKTINDNLNINSEPFSLEELIKALTDKATMSMQQVFQIEKDIRQELLDDAYKQILDAKKKANSELSLE